METTMQNLQSRFQAISDQIISKNILLRWYEMGTRIDDLENDVADLMAQAGTEEQPASK
ncbi:heat shock factor-binding protein 1-like protein 1 [Aplochiton taeniatus]